MPHKNTAPRVRSENQELKSKDAQQHPSTKVWKIKLPHCPLKRWWSSLNAGFTYNLLNLSFKCTTRSWAIFAQTSTFFHAILQDSQHITQSTWSDRDLETNLGLVIYFGHSTVEDLIVQYSRIGDRITMLLHHGTLLLRQGFVFQGGLGQSSPYPRRRLSQGVILSRSASSLRICLAGGKARPNIILYYKICTKYFPILFCTTKLVQNPSQYYIVL